MVEEKIDVRDLAPGTTLTLTTRRDTFTFTILDPGMRTVKVGSLRHVIFQRKTACKLAGSREKGSIVLWVGRIACGSYTELILQNHVRVILGPLKTFSVRAPREKPR